MRLPFVILGRDRWERIQLTLAAWEKFTAHLLGERERCPCCNPAPFIPATTETS